MDTNSESNENPPQTNPETPSAPSYKFVVYPGNYPEVIRDALLRRGNFSEIKIAPSEDVEKLLPELSLIWRPFLYSRPVLSKIESANYGRNYSTPLVFNHIEGLKSITSKTGIVRSLRSFYSSSSAAVEQKYTIFESLPTSYILEPNVEDEEYFAFLQRYKEIAQGVHYRGTMPEKHCEKNYWLIKPANLNQGRGIEISNSLKDIKAFIESKPAHTKWVLQKYIEKPLLYKNRKFDIRVWALVTDRADVFFYKDGYLRTSSEEFTFDSSLNYVHLTNNCLQKWGDNYGKHEEGNTIGFEALQDYFDEVCKELKISLQEHIIPRIKDLILDTIFAVKSKIVVPTKKRLCNFELLGYDFMIDEDFRVWLIEVNTNPYLGIPNKFIGDILPHMLDDMFSLVLDPIYPSKEPRTEKNNFELLYCEKESIYSQFPVNVRQNYKKEGLYPIKEFIRPKKHHKKEKTNVKELKALENKRGTLLNMPAIEASQKAFVVENKPVQESNVSNRQKRVFAGIKKSQTAPVGTLEEQAKEAIKIQQWGSLKAIFEKIVTTIKDPLTIDQSIIINVNSFLERKRIDYSLR